MGEGVDEVAGDAEGQGQPEITGDDAPSPPDAQRTGRDRLDVVDGFFITAMLK